jgi:hypothetical protein
MEKELKDLKEATQELKEKVAKMPDKEPEWKEKLAESPMNDYYTENLNEECPALARYAEFRFHGKRLTTSLLLDEHGLTVKCHHVRSWTLLRDRNRALGCQQPGRATCTTEGDRS